MSFPRLVGIALVAVSGPMGCRHFTVEHTDRLVSTTPYQSPIRRLPEADHVEVVPAAVAGGVEIRLKEQLVCVREEGEDVKTERTTVRRPDWEYTGLKLGAVGLAAGGIVLLASDAREETKSCSPNEDCYAGMDQFALAGVLAIAGTPFLVMSITDIAASRTKRSSSTERRPTRFQQEACSEEPARVALRLPDGEVLRGKALTNGNYFVAIPDSILTRYSGRIQADIYVRERIIRHVQIAQVSP